MRKKRMFAASATDVRMSTSDVMRKTPKVLSRKMMLSVYKTLPVSQKVVRK